ncbi:MAG: hypothetical protein QFF03_17675 [Pseudomonadota bacterium]|nr:hypothetical protein [Pseudomonadota bacterium]
MLENDRRDPALPSPFDALRDEMATLNAPPGVHKELMAAFASAHPPRRWYQRFAPAPWHIAGGVGASAALLLAVTLALHAPGRLAHDADSAPIGRDDSGAPFIALASFARIEQEPAPRMVEATVPRTALATLGVPVSPENAGDLVHAEMLVGADGHPLALRLALQ